MYTPTDRPVPALEPDRVPAGVKRAWIAGVVSGLVATGAVTVISSDPSPEDVVADYFEAITGGDVETALGYLGSYPTGETARFITADAVSPDWKVMSIRERGGGDFDSESIVEVRIGGPDGTAEGRLTVVEDDANGWQISESTTRVNIAASPLEYTQVNGYTPRPQPTDNAVLNYAGPRSYELLPGMYTFYEDIPGVVSVASGKTFAALPGGNDSSTDINVYAPGEIVAKHKTIASAGKRLKTLLDECVKATVPRPGGCPFGVGGFVNTPDGEHLEELRDLSWKVDEYPTVELTDPRYDDEAPTNTGNPATGFRLTAGDTAAVTLTGTGIDTDDKTVDFTIQCHLDLSTASATVDTDGNVTLSGIGPSDGMEDGAGTCGKE